MNTDDLLTYCIYLISPLVEHYLHRKQLWNPYLMHFTYDSCTSDAEFQKQTTFAHRWCSVSCRYRLKR